MKKNTHTPTRNKIKIITPFIIIILSLLLPISSNAQCPDCPDYDMLIKEGENHYTNERYAKAIFSYQAAQVAAGLCKCKAEVEAGLEVKKCVEKLEQQKKDALKNEAKATAAAAAAKKSEAKAKQAEANAEQKTKEAEESARAAIAAKDKANQLTMNLEKEKEKLEKQQAKNEKLINAFHFHGDSLALASQESSEEIISFGFINKKGEIRIEYQYEEAENFDYRGLAKVVRDNTNYLIDTKGNEYKVAYKVEDLADDILAFDARGIDLDSFPIEILDFNQLRVLILDGKWDSLDDIKSIPDECSKLKELRFLFLKYTEIVKLPESIGDLKNLTSLDLSGTFIRELPASIGNLQNLTSLNLMDSQIAKLPESIGDLKNLTSLNLMHSQITELPESISQLQKLTSLNLGITAITELSTSISNLQNLTELNLKYLRITELPESIGNLVNLKYLNLQETQIPKEEIESLKQQLPNCHIEY